MGIGLNINQKEFKSEAPNPVSLSQVTGRVFNLEEALSDLCLKIDTRYSQLRNGAFRQIDEDYTAMLYQFGSWSQYSDENGDFEGRILGIDLIGRLLIEIRNGNINKYHFKEVVFK